MISRLASLQANVDALEMSHGYGVNLLGNLPFPLDHIKDAPFETKEFWVKQISQERLTDLGRAALGTAFPAFGDVPSEEKRRTEYAELMSAKLNVRFAAGPRVNRRWAGDQNLPRGRYYALCDEYGNDEGTLEGELRAYYTPSRAGVVQMYDCTLPEILNTVRQDFEIPATDPNMLLFGFPPINGNANPFVKTFSDLVRQKGIVTLFASKKLLIGLPLTVKKVRRERVLDLRQPRSAKWFARTLSTLAWRAGDPSSRCFPQRPPLERFTDLLPELLAQQLGGGGACIAAGVLLRHLGADGLIFPSARNDAHVLIEDGTVVDHRGWNFVDYAEAPAPDFVAYFEEGKQWPTQVGFRPSVDAHEKDVAEWYPEITVSSNPNGSWQTRGLRRRINLQWRLQLMQYSLECCKDDLSDDAFGTLYTCPEVLAGHGAAIDIAGMLCKLVYEAVIGTDNADKRLAAFCPELHVFPGFKEGVAELLEKVPGPSREKAKEVEAMYMPYQGLD